MEQGKITNPTVGQWGRFPTTDKERSPKVVFEVNIPVVVTFKTDEPIEMPSDAGQDSVYYIFEVTSNNQDMIISTSAWTLLKALKVLSPLKGKTISIVKKLVKGKQTFEVTKI